MNRFCLADNAKDIEDLERLFSERLHRQKILDGIVIGTLTNSEKVIFEKEKMEITYKICEIIRNIIDFNLRDDNNELTLMLNNLPENRPLYKDGGLWQVTDENLEDVKYMQKCGESFYDFIERVLNFDNQFKEFFW